MTDIPLEDPNRNVETYKRMVREDETLRETMELLNSTDLIITIEPSVIEMTAMEFVEMLDQMHLPVDGPDGKVCKTCDSAQGWPCITRVLIDSTVF